MKLIVFGSTGGTGRQIVAQALDQGHEVTAFARSPEKIELNHNKLKIIKGDVLDYDSVESAIQGHDAVLCTLGLAPKDKNNLRAKGTKNIIRAMEKADVKRFICQSSDGVGNSRETLPFIMKYLIVPFMLRHAFADHEIQETYIRESHLDWIIVRPAALTDGEHKGLYQQDYTDGNIKVTYKISRADTADFMLKQLGHNRYLFKTPSISY